MDFVAFIAVLTLSTGVAFGVAWGVLAFVLHLISAPHPSASAMNTGPSGHVSASLPGGAVSTWFGLESGVTDAAEVMN
jgi:hypothetical protein